MAASEKPMKDYVIHMRMIANTGRYTAWLCLMVMPCKNLLSCLLKLWWIYAAECTPDIVIVYAITSF